MNLSKAAVAIFAALIVLTPLVTAKEKQSSLSGLSEQLDAARNIVSAVNAKDSNQYVQDLDPDVVVRMYDGAVRLRGKAAIRKNRAQHFLSHPEARNVLIHLVEVDNRVVMHDQIWLTRDQSEPADIVEIFTFEEGKIVRIDVIQPEDLFTR
ncbi:MAG: nuclear transport factor 2 family protein [Congregibacter sp.]